MVKERLLAWVKAHEAGGRQILPDNTIYYRDGVSEGQYAKVTEVEIEAIRQSYTAVAQQLVISTQELKITAIIAAKHHHTRFFPTTRADERGTAANCMPGTLVDDGVISPYFTDFYLQSHSGLQGTARPTHYFLLENGIKMGLKDLQRFVSHSGPHLRLY
jgi:eukaryotic translation initiation factor 2C